MLQQGQGRGQQGLRRSRRQALLRQGEQPGPGGGPGLCGQRRQELQQAVDQPAAAQRGPLLGAQGTAQRRLRQARP